MEGTKQRGAYVTVPHSIFEGYVFLIYDLKAKLSISRRTLRIDAIDNSLLAFVASDMPYQLKEGLTRALKTSLEASDHYPNLWENVEDSERVEGFDCFHFSVYARYLTQVRRYSTRGQIAN